MRKGDCLRAFLAMIAEVLRPPPAALWPVGDGLGHRDRLDVLLEDMRRITAEILGRLVAQDGLLNYIFILIAASLAAVLPLATKADWDAMRWVLLLIPILACSVGFVYVSHELMIYSAAAYITTEVYPKIREIAGPGVLRWETFLCDQKTKPVRRFVSLFRPLVLFLPSALSLVVFYATGKQRSAVWEHSIVALDILTMVILAVGVVHAARCHASVGRESVGGIGNEKS